MSIKKRVLITGGSSGIGKESAKFLSSCGYKVYVGSREPSKLDDIKSPTLKPIYLDITSKDSVKEAIESIEDIDILVNNAGYGLVSTIEEMDEDEMFNQFNVNLFGLLRVTKAVIPAMRKNGAGVIINISSFLGRVGLPLLALYNSSKYAVEGITDSLRYELKDFNIRVHSIMPGFFDTNFARDNLVINSNILSKDTPYKKLIDNLAPNIIEQINSGNSPKEVAELILQIIEDENSLARYTAGEKSKKFIPMRRELSDEDFERRVREYYNL